MVSWWNVGTDGWRHYNVVIHCHNLAKQLSHYLYLLYFTLLLDLLHREECGNVSCHKCHSHMVTLHDKSHDEYEKVVHKPCSSCINSIKNPTETPLSSFCQLRLGGWLSRLG